MKKLSKDSSINIAIIAMGGQGGGVLSKWILDLADSQGYLAQYTSVPGVAQRTGATIYYIELFPAHLAEQAGQKPVLALTPIPGDVDIVIASEMMEAGRALVRGFVSSDTTMIASSHRDYAIVEKQEMGDGRRDLTEVREICEKSAKTFVCFDMDAAARESGSVISSILLGALAGSEALPFDIAAYHKTIENSKKAVEANLRGFKLGHNRASSALPERTGPDTKPDASPSKAVQGLLSRMKSEFPGHAHYLILEGLKKLVDYQGPDYASDYLDRLAEFKHLDETLGGKRRDWRLTKDMARYLALAMAYEDTARVADLKIRETRFYRFRDEVKAADGQIVNVSEFMHPRIEEICDILPVALGRSILKGGLIASLMKPFLGKGRRITTTKLPGFIMLYFIAGFKKSRRKSYRFQIEIKRIESWLDEIRHAAEIQYELACEIAGLQRLVKGYGDTHERGLRNMHLVLEAYHSIKSRPDALAALIELKKSALTDDEGRNLSSIIEKYSVPLAEVA